MQSPIFQVFRPASKPLFPSDNSNEERKWCTAKTLAGDVRWVGCQWMVPWPFCAVQLRWVRCVPPYVYVWGTRTLNQGSAWFSGRNPSGIIAFLRPWLSGILSSWVYVIRDKLPISLDPFSNDIRSRNGKGDLVGWGGVWISWWCEISSCRPKVKKGVSRLVFTMRGQCLRSHRNFQSYPCFKLPDGGFSLPLRGI